MGVASSSPQINKTEKFSKELLSIVTGSTQHATADAKKAALQRKLKEIASCHLNLTLLYSSPAALLQNTVFSDPAIADELLVLLLESCGFINLKLESVKTILNDFSAEANSDRSPTIFDFILRLEAIKKIPKLFEKAPKDRLTPLECLVMAGMLELEQTPAAWMACDVSYASFLQRGWVLLSNCVVERVVRARAYYNGKLKQLVIACVGVSPKNIRVERDFILSAAVGSYELVDSVISQQHVIMEFYNSSLAQLRKENRGALPDGLSITFTGVDKGAYVASAALEHKELRDDGNISAVTFGVPDCLLPDKKYKMDARNKQHYVSERSCEECQGLAGCQGGEIFLLEPKNGGRFFDSFNAQTGALDEGKAEILVEGRLFPFVPNFLIVSTLPTPPQIFLKRIAKNLSLLLHLSLSDDQLSPLLECQFFYNHDGVLTYLQLPNDKTSEAFLAILGGFVQENILGFLDNVEKKLTISDLELEKAYLSEVSCPKKNLYLHLMLKEYLLKLRSVYQSAALSGCFTSQPLALKKLDIRFWELQAHRPRNLSSGEVEQYIANLASISVVAAAGAGKTTFCQQLLYRWAAQQCCHNFEFVFHVSLSNVESVKNNILEQLQVSTEGTVREAVWRNLLARGKQVLLLLDDNSFRTEEALTKAFHVLDELPFKKMVFSQCAVKNAPQVLAIHGLTDKAIEHQLTDDKPFDLYALRRPFDLDMLQFFLQSNLQIDVSGVTNRTMLYGFWQMLLEDSEWSGLTKISFLSRYDKDKFPLDIKDFSIKEVVFEKFEKLNLLSKAQSDTKEEPGRIRVKFVSRELHAFFAARYLVDVFKSHQGGNESKAKTWLTSYVEKHFPHPIFCEMLPFLGGLLGAYPELISFIVELFQKHIGAQGAACKAYVLPFIAEVGALEVVRPLTALIWLLIDARFDTELMQQVAMHNSPVLQLLWQPFFEQPSQFQEKFLSFADPRARRNNVGKEIDLRYGDDDINSYLDQAIQRIYGRLGRPVDYCLKTPIKDSEDGKFYQIAVVPAVNVLEGESRRNTDITCFLDNKRAGFTSSAEEAKVLIPYYEELRNIDDEKVCKERIKTLLKRAASEDLINWCYGRVKECVDSGRDFSQRLRAAKGVRPVIESNESDAAAAAAVVQREDENCDVFDEFREKIESGVEAHYKIYFPYNVGQRHWKLGEIVIHQNPSHQYEVHLLSYDPAATFDQMDKTSYKKIIAAVERRIKDIDSEAKCSFQNVETKLQARYQAVGDGDSCGAIVAQILLNALRGTLHSDARTHELYALQLRRAQLLQMRAWGEDLVPKHGVNTFVERNAARVGEIERRLGSAAEPSLDGVLVSAAAAAAASESIPRKDGDFNDELAAAFANSSQAS